MGTDDLSNGIDAWNILGGLQTSGTLGGVVSLFSEFFCPIFVGMEDVHTHNGVRYVPIKVIGHPTRR